MEDLAQVVSEVFTRFASRADAAIVIDRQSRLVNPGMASTNTNSSSQSSAASLACSEPNNSVTALMNAPSSRSAMVINLANVGPSLFGSSLTTLVHVHPSLFSIREAQKL